MKKPRSEKPASTSKDKASVGRRNFLTGSAAVVASTMLGRSEPRADRALLEQPGSDAASETKEVGAKLTKGHTAGRRAFNSAYSGEYLNQVAFPLGGIGAGMICLEGAGAISHVSIRNHPDLFNEPFMFAAVSIKGKESNARVLEGPVPTRKVLDLAHSGDGDGATTYGLPRFQNVTFEARFPFGKASLSDPLFPLAVELTGWSPFEPGNADDSSLPVAALEYNFKNCSSEPIEAVFSFNSWNFLMTDGCPNAVQPTDGGFVLWNGPAPEARWQEASFSATVRSPEVKVNHCWFRGLQWSSWAWWQPETMAWRDVERAACYDSPAVEGSSPGASLFVPLHLAPKGSAQAVLQLAWHAGWSSLRLGDNPENKTDTYRPWYAGRFNDIKQVTAYWRENYEDLRKRTQRFSDCLCDSTLPPEVIEAVAANLTILKSPTVLRQTDGRLWGWEGCDDNEGSCAGSCTHVWNYAQAVPHLFPDLERTLRETEFGPCQLESGRQAFRSPLPIRPGSLGELDAADGQLGGIIKVYREWRISGDDAWLKSLWPRVKKSLEYSIKKWDPRQVGLVEEPAHNTYDIEFWAPEPMCTGLYLCALQAAVLMSRAMGEDPSVYEELVTKGKAAMELELFNGEYFYQKARGDRERDRYLKYVETISSTVFGPMELSPEARALIEKEGPIYQYGDGCLSSGMLGPWLSCMSGVSHPVSPAKVAGHLRAIHRYNLKRDLSTFANTHRPNYAIGHEGGMLICTWPQGGEPGVPVNFCDEVWTGIEYAVASHLICEGIVQEGLEIVRACRSRYDGRVRNPFDEFECGHWYARAMSSYGLLQALSGARYDAVDKVLYLSPRIKGDFRAFIATATGYGTVGVRDGSPFLEVVWGSVPYTRIDYIAT